MAKVFKNLPYFIACIVLALIIVLSSANPAEDSRLVMLSKSPGSMDRVLICIDPGHGGFDGGAVGRVKRTKEAEINLSISFMLKEKLEAVGASVILTREQDEALGDDKKTDLLNRRNFVRDSGADIMISIHQNSHPVSKNFGPGVFYLTDDEDSKPLAEALQKSLNQALNTVKPRFIHAGNFYMMKTDIPSVIVEGGFLSNAEEERKLIDTEYQLKIADAVLAGIIDYFGSKYSLIIDG